MAASLLIRSVASLMVSLMVLGTSPQAIAAVDSDPSKNSTNSKKPIILNTINLPPFHYAKDGKVVGLIPPVIACALDKMDQPYEMRVIPWKRSQKEVEDGVAQGFFAGRKNDERDRYAMYSDPVSYKIWNWYVRKDIDLKPTDPEFKKTVPIGVLAGTDDAAELKAKGYQTVPLKTSKQIAQMLDAKRIGAARMIDVTMKDAVNETGGNLNDFNTYFFGSFPNVAYFEKKFIKKNPEFLPQFNHALGECFDPRNE